MRHRIHAPLPAVLAVLLVALVACGGDDSQAERKTREEEQSTPAPAVAAPRDATSTPSAGGSRTAGGNGLQLNCGDEIKAFRFEGKLAIQGPQGSTDSNDPLAGFSSLLNDVKFNGAYVAPDRTQLKVSLDGQDSILAGQAVEFVQIGDTSYTRLGSSGWQQSSGGGDGIEALDPRQFCRQLEESGGGGVRRGTERVNGVSAVRYEYDRAAILNLEGFLGDGLDEDSLPENTRMNVWIAEREKFPVKFTISGSGQVSGQRSSLDVELNVTDLNASGIKIDAPR